MKGQISFAPETIMKALSFVIITVALVGTLIAYFQYQVVYESFNEMRQTIDYAENVMSSTCLVYEKDGTHFKGVFDKKKLDVGVDACIQIEIFKRASFEIVDEKGHTWGSKTLSPKNSIQYPVVIKYPTGYVLGRMEVTVS